ncbi:CoA ester lyase [Nonomuraea longicatena]|uniref:CoA ester lyase n=1 Tax=Nonomuraea longicatena TaxID=83682 RepID=A0ABP4AQQ3_9ACTN
MIVTWLYVPGDRPERFAKAAASGADAVIIDLEDAVAPARKDAALANVLAYLGDRPEGGPQIHVRVNDLAGPRGRADLAALAGAPGLDGVRVPKVESAAGVPEPGVPVYALLESAAGLLNAAEIAAHPAVAGVALGEQDLAAELSIADEGAMEGLRLGVVLAAAAAGLPPVAMSVYPDLKDEEGLVASCVRGRARGMFGRTALHPRQVPAIRRGFRPSEEEAARAREIVAAAEASDAGALALPDGRFVDAPVLRRARRVLELRERLAP